MTNEESEMKRWEFVSKIAVLTMLLGMAAGCKRDEPAPSLPDEPKAKAPATKKVEQTALQATALDGVIKGRVVFDGAPPEMAALPALLAHKDCMSGGAEFEKRDQTWIVGADQGVANVVVWLSPPKGQYFQLKDEDKNRTGQLVTIDQPHCAFLPHVTAVYPKYFDGKKHQPTGQVFKVKNSATFSHNSSWVGDPLAGNQGNQTIPPGSDLVIELAPQRDPVNISCSIHSWMRAKVWVFDHPYHGVTDGDGNFQIKNVPTGVDLTLTAWHEAKGKFETRTVKFMQGDNAVDLKVKQ